ncbi:MAG: GWxTD domain-containing protein [Candidatus Marinimicrobia bacterium]|nr:GWxTD domain-containing protein [Candidatus Neomarinimicrobiota bacterium]MCF7850544.1 GWxTD domain-containing protein [Candidatus Neomarinimicrobiota bacterium]MCF7904118.1 GWxTD domain-containing protein [Candidatus Neomarinimicrobiota bacterium]
MFQYNSIKFVAVLTILTAGICAAGDYEDVDLGVSLDYSRFSIEGGVYLDVYLLVPQANMTFAKTSDGLAANVIFQAALLQGDVVPYEPDRWQRIFRVKDQDVVAKLGFSPDITKFFVQEGEYTLQVDILDANSNRRQRIRRPVSLKNFPEGELSFSDITLASKIEKAKQENEFTKYGHDVLPNAERTFTSLLPVLYYFFEVYGLSDGGKYEVSTVIKNLSDKIVKELPVRPKQSPGTSAVEWGGINTSGLKNGIYSLVVTVTDLGSGTSVTHDKTFYIVKPIVAGESMAEANEYTDVTEDDLDKIFEMVNVVMTANEKRLYKKSNPEGKRKTLVAFWQRKDPDSSTPVNEFKQEFYRRVQLANAEFGKGNTEGWKTDRGRVLIQYGPPSNIEKSLMSIGQRPWEGWYYYDMEGGVEFIFVDRSGFGRFDLVHSTARSELEDQNWSRFLNSRD